MAGLLGTVDQELMENIQNERPIYKILDCCRRNCPRNLLNHVGSMKGFRTGLLTLILLWSGPALAHDAAHPEFQEWYESLKAPDNPNVPCCGIADAYWADVARVRDGKTYAIITDERPDQPLKRHHVPLGTEIEVPKEKLKWDAGNPTGHVVIFLNVNNVALCYVQGSGT